MREHTEAATQPYHRLVGLAFEIENGDELTRAPDDLLARAIDAHDR
jgi:hypothetical protein